MFQKIRKIIFKILLGEYYYDFLITHLNIHANKLYESYKKWKPSNNIDIMDINLYGWCYNNTVGILDKMGAKYVDEQED